MLFWFNVLVAYSVATEVVQGLLNSICHRCFAWEDIGQDILGVLLGTLFGYFCRRWISKSKNWH
jgi:hypothetical protein